MSLQQHKYTKGIPIIWFHITWPPPCYPCSTSFDEYLPTTTGRARVRNHATDHTLQRQVEFPIRITLITSQDYQTRQLNTEEGNLTHHSVYTQTSNTCQPKPQLKSSSCSSAITSHNSRDFILSHNSRNVTCLTPIPSHNSRDTF